MKNKTLIWVMGGEVAGVTPIRTYGRQHFNTVCVEGKSQKNVHGVSYLIEQSRTYKHGSQLNNHKYHVFHLLMVLYEWGGVSPVGGSRSVTHL